MQCPNKVPLKGYKDILGNQVYRPCGGCAVCRQNKVMALTARANYAWKEHPYCSFVTLTYDDNHLYYKYSVKSKMDMPIGLPSLNRTHATKVVDDLRHYLKRHNVKFCEKKFEFVLCGEYGGQFGRPHLHLCLFGVDFPAAKKILQKVWYYGFVDSKPLENGAIRYVIKYLGKQETGVLKDVSYHDRGIEPPFVVFSKGLGARLFSDHIDDINKYGAIRYGSKFISVPAYYRDKFINLNYDSLLERAQTSEYNRVYSKANEARYFGYKSIKDYEIARARNFIAADKAKRILHRETIDLYER